MRKAFRLLLLCCVVGLTSTAEAYVPEWAKHGPQGINFTDLAPSPDGKIIAFEYADISEGEGPTGVGFVDLHSGKATRIPNPLGRELRHPSFSYDGKKLVVAIGSANLDSNQIAEVNLDNLKLTPITPVGPHGRMHPTYQPGTGDVLYVNGSGSYGLILLNPRTGKEAVILENQRNGFAHMQRPFFIGNNAIIFQASGSLNFEMQKKETLDWNLRTGIGLAYKLSFGKMPELLSLESELEEQKTRFAGGAFDQLSASSAGKSLVFVRVRHDTPTDETHKILSELYTMKSDKVLQLTDIHNSILYSRLSYDGSIDAIVADITEPRKFDLFIYDMKSGEIKSTNLLDQIRSDPAFALR